MPSQLKPLIILFAIAVVALLILRHLLVPETFGRDGHYRAAAVDLEKNLSLRYAGHLSCRECHEDVAAVKSESKHFPISCEACHGPGYAHTEDPIMRTTSPDLQDFPRSIQRSTLVTSSASLATIRISPIPRNQ